MYWGRKQAFSVTHYYSLNHFADVCEVGTEAFATTSPPTGYRVEAGSDIVTTCDQGFFVGTLTSVTHTCGTTQFCSREFIFSLHFQFIVHLPYHLNEIEVLQCFIISPIVVIFCQLTIPSDVQILESVISKPLQFCIFIL